MSTCDASNSLSSLTVLARPHHRTGFRAFRAVSRAPCIIQLNLAKEWRACRGTEARLAFYRDVDGRVLVLSRPVARGIRVSAVSWHILFRQYLGR